MFIESVPKLTLGDRDQIRRFITLIDALYDHQVRLVVSTRVENVCNIFSAGEDDVKASAMDEVFAWERTISRLIEMFSEEYQLRHARRLPVDQFFGQFEEPLSEDDLRDIFGRYDKNNDQVIAVSGLNRLLNERAKVLGDNGVHVAGQTLLERLADGHRIKFERFKNFVQKDGLDGLFRINRD